MSYEITHTTEDGIERIVYTPRRQRFATPLLFQHGMWHGAWCWRLWQELFAEWGWQSIAFSLPGHGRSPEQRPIRWCTLNYYFEFLVTEVKRLPQRPVLFGHSMGGALTQWYLKYCDDLPGAVLVAPWPSHDMRPTMYRVGREKPLGTILGWLTFSATPAVRTPELAAYWFLTEGATMSPEELHARLGPESGLVMLQYRPPFWRPAAEVKTPTFWLGAERDRCCLERDVCAAASYYGGDYMMIPGVGHDLMIERSFRETAETVQSWLRKQDIE